MFLKGLLSLRLLCSGQLSTLDSHFCLLHQPLKLVVPLRREDAVPTELSQDDHDHGMLIAIAEVVEMNSPSGPSHGRGQQETLAHALDEYSATYQADSVSPVKGDLYDSRLHSPNTTSGNKPNSAGSSPIPFASDSAQRQGRRDETPSKFFIVDSNSFADNNSAKVNLLSAIDSSHEREQPQQRTGQPSDQDKQVDLRSDDHVTNMSSTGASGLVGEVGSMSPTSTASSNSELIKKAISRNKSFRSLKISNSNSNSNNNSFYGSVKESEAVQDVDGNSGKGGKGSGINSIINKFESQIKKRQEDFERYTVEVSPKDRRSFQREFFSTENGEIFSYESIEDLKILLANNSKYYNNYYDNYYSKKYADEIQNIKNNSMKELHALQDEKNREIEGLKSYLVSQTADFHHKINELKLNYDVRTQENEMRLATEIEVNKAQYHNKEADLTNYYNVKLTEQQQHYDNYYKEYYDQHYKGYYNQYYEDYYREDMSKTIQNYEAKIHEVETHLTNHIRESEGLLKFELNDAKALRLAKENEYKGKIAELVTENNEIVTELRKQYAVESAQKKKELDALKHEYEKLLQVHKDNGDVGELRERLMHVEQLLQEKERFLLEQQAEMDSFKKRTKEMYNNKLKIELKELDSKHQVKLQELQTTINSINNNVNNNVNKNNSNSNDFTDSSAKSSIEDEVILLKHDNNVLLVSLEQLKEEFCAATDKHAEAVGNSNQAVVLLSQENTVLKERVVQLQQQHDSTQRECEELRSQNSTLKTKHTKEIDQLITKVSDSEVAVINLRKVQQECQELRNRYNKLRESSNTKLHQLEVANEAIQKSYETLVKEMEEKYASSEQQTEYKSDDIINYYETMLEEKEAKHKLQLNDMELQYMKLKIYNDNSSRNSSIPGSLKSSRQNSMRMSPLRIGSPDGTPNGGYSEIYNNIRTVSAPTTPSSAIKQGSQTVTTKDISKLQADHDLKLEAVRRKYEEREAYNTLKIEELTQLLREERTEHATLVDKCKSRAVQPLVSGVDTPWKKLYRWLAMGNLLLWLASLCVISEVIVVSTTPLHTNDNAVAVPDSIPSGTNASNSSDWEYIGTFNTVETFIKTVEGSDLVAVKGILSLDGIHLSEVLGPFFDISISTQWVDLLQEAVRFDSLQPSKRHVDYTTYYRSLVGHYPSNYAVDGRVLPLKSKLNSYDQRKGVPTVVGGTEDVVYQRYSLPWPISPRDFVLSRRYHYDMNNKTVIVQYSSTVDARLPEKTNVIRGHCEYTNWKFHMVYVNSSRDSGEVCSVDKKMDNEEQSKESTPESISSAPKEHTRSNFRQRLVAIRQGVVNASKKVVCVLFFRIKHFKFCKNGNISETAARIVETNTVTEEATSIHRNCGESVKLVIELESFVDNKGTLPEWLVNYIQRYQIVLNTCVTKALNAGTSALPLKIYRYFLLVLHILCTTIYLITLMCHHSCRSWPEKTLNSLKTLAYQRKHDIHLPVLEW